MTGKLMQIQSATGIGQYVQCRADGKVGTGVGNWQGHEVKGKEKEKGFEIIGKLVNTARRISVSITAS